MRCEVIPDGRGGVIFACRSRRSSTPTCAFCGRPSVALCDHVTGTACCSYPRDSSIHNGKSEVIAISARPFHDWRAKTCDKNLCAEHRYRVGPNEDLCPDHAPAEPVQDSLFRYAAGERVKCKTSKAT